jgi:hypothetical protein
LLKYSKCEEKTLKKEADGKFFLSFFSAQCCFFLTDFLINKKLDIGVHTQRQSFLAICAFDKHKSSVVVPVGQNSVNYFLYKNSA